MENTHDIIIQNARKTYGDHTALAVEKLEVKPGECLGLVGNNGAGKTTLFRALLDLIPLDAGEVKLGGLTVNKSEDWKKFTGAYLDDGFLIDFLKPDEYFEFAASAHGVSRDDLNAQLSRFEPMFNNEITGKKAFIRDLSMGNRKKTGIAAAFIGNPKIVILDEPFANLDPSGQFKLREVIAQIIAEQNITVMISSHDLSHVAEICSRIIILHEGKILKDIAETNTQTLNELETFFRGVK